MDNYEKRNKYALLMKKLDIATKEEFYYEAIFIEYAIFEERMDSILRHAKMPKMSKLHYKINAIKNAKWFKDEYVQKHINKKMLDDIIKWKDVRNELIHDLVNCTYGSKEIKSIALKGEILLKRFTSKSQLVNKYLDENLKNGNSIKFDKNFKFKKAKSTI